MKFQLTNEEEEEETLFYPNFASHIQIKSSRIPQKLVDLLLKKVTAEAEKSSKTGKLHAASIFDNLDRVLRSNNLIPVFTEMPQIKKILGDKDEIKTFENAGKVKITLRF